MQVKIQYKYISRINWDTYSKPKNCIAKWRQWFHNIINCTTKWRRLLHNIMDCITKWRRLHNKMASTIAQQNGDNNAQHADTTIAHQIRLHIVVAMSLCDIRFRVPLYYYWCLWTLGLPNLVCWLHIWISLTPR